MKPKGLEGLTGSAVLLEMSGPMGDRSIVPVPVPAVAVPRIAGSPVIGPAAFSPVGRVPMPGGIDDGVGPELVEPVVGAGKLPITAIDAFVLGTVVAAPAAWGVGA